MQTKLTLRIDNKSIIFAKSYSKRTHQSISKIVENYFVGLAATVQKPAPIKQTEPLPPLVAALSGCMVGSGVSEQDYKKHLEEKYR